MNLFRSLIAAIALTLLTIGSASAQCGTSAPANKVCGNNTGSPGLAQWVTVSTGGLTPIAGGTVLANPTGSPAAPVATTAPVLGIPGTSTGQIGLAGSGSGTAILQAQVAAGSGVSLLPTLGGTLAGSVSSPLVLNATTGLMTCPTCVTSSGGGAITGTAPIAVSGAGVVSITGLSGAVLAGASPAFSRTPILGVNGTATGTLGFAGVTSGTVTITPQAAAGAATLTLPTTTGTLVSSATAPLSINAATGVISLATPLTPTFGGSGANLSGTGGTNQIVQQSTLGGNFTVGTMATTINGTSCTVGSSCSPTAAASSITVGSTTVLSGTTTRVLFDNAGVLGEYSISGSGNVAMTTSPSFTTPSLGVATGTSLALGGAAIGTNALAASGTSSLGGAVTITATLASALCISPNGACSNPQLQVDTSVASTATGIKITGAAAGGGAAIAAISSGTNENLTINAKASGGILIGNVSNGGVSIGGAGGGITLTGTLSGSAFGTNVATAIGTATGSVNGFPLIIASGTIALGTSLIAAGACSAAATASGTGIATTDVIDVGFNTDPTAVTGYTASAMLSLVVYPTANTVNVKQCNLTASSITPSALTMNWKVRR